MNIESVDILQAIRDGVTQAFVSAQTTPQATSPIKKAVKKGMRFESPVVANFIGRFVFVCRLRIEDGWCYLTEVKNIRYWEARENGLADLAENGASSGDKVDSWPDVTVPLDKLGPVISANPEHWK